MLRASLPLMLLLVLLASGSFSIAHAQQAPKSSLYELVERTAAEIEYRAQFENASGPVRVEISSGRGVDARRTHREFGARLLRRLRVGALVTPSLSSKIRVRISLSEERGTVWSTGTLEGGRLLAPVHFAVKMPIDRELEMALGASSRKAGARWVVSRLGNFDNGVLDIVVVNEGEEVSETLAILSLDALRFFRVTQTQFTQVGKAYPLPKRVWPRVTSGHLARGEGGLFLSTSAGHKLFYDFETKKFRASGIEGVPLSQPQGESLFAKGPFGGAGLKGPLTNQSGQPLTLPGPSGFRDFVRSPFHEDTAVWIDDEGRLGAMTRGRAKTLASQERAGDRLLLVDLDEGGEGELVTTQGVSYGESDELTITTMDSQMQSAQVVMRRRLSGGTIVALADGDLNFDGRPEVYAFEEFLNEEGVLWRVEFTP